MALEIGSVFKSNNFGNFKVIEQVAKNRYLVEFENTGGRTTSSYEAIRHGRVKDKFAPLIAGVGYIGIFEGMISDPSNIIFYRPWNDMLHRCYDPNDADYPLYGALGIRVDPAWFDFGTYFEDVKHIEGYDKKLKWPNLYQLDKDYLQMHLPKSERVYSKNTCIWISKYDNIALMNAEMAPNRIGISYRDNGYNVRLNNRRFGKYTNYIAAANAANIALTMYKCSNPHANIPILNNVPYMPPEEFIKYQINPKIMCEITNKQC